MIPKSGNRFSDKIMRMEKDGANAYVNAMQDQPRTARSCPICSKPALEPFRPFCSKRCADVDLNRWLSGAYAIPVREGEEEDPE